MLTFLSYTTTRLICTTRMSASASSKPQNCVQHWVVLSFGSPRGRSPPLSQLRAPLHQCPHRCYTSRWITTGNKFWKCWMLPCCTRSKNQNVSK